MLAELQTSERTGVGRWAACVRGRVTDTAEGTRGGRAQAADGWVAGAGGSGSAGGRDGGQATGGTDQVIRLRTVASQRGPAEMGAGTVCSGGSRGLLRDAARLHSHRLRGTPSPALHLGLCGWESNGALRVAEAQPVVQMGDRGFGRGGDWPGPTGSQSRVSTLPTCPGGKGQRLAEGTSA